MILFSPSMAHSVTKSFMWYESKNNTPPKKKKHNKNKKNKQKTSPQPKSQYSDRSFETENFILITEWAKEIENTIMLVFYTALLAGIRALYHPMFSVFYSPC